MGEIYEREQVRGPAIGPRASAPFVEELERG
jgi:hypothetical protein